MKKYGYLGPRGTNAEEALLSYAAEEEQNLVPLGTVSEVIKAVEDGTIDAGVVPIENSIEGSVNETLDMLALETEEATIEREIIISINHCLIAKAGLAKKDIVKIISHPQASAQCRRYLQTHFPQIAIAAANSTAEAVNQAAQSDQSNAAIGSKLAAEIYGLQILDEDIEDFKDNRTRFALVSKKTTKPTGNDKTSIVCFIHEDRPGSLLQILQELAFRYINLTKIQSRPTKKALGDYCFFIDMEGHIEDPKIDDAMKCLRCKLRSVKVLGSYPRG